VQCDFEDEFALESFIFQSQRRHFSPYHAPYITSNYFSLAQSRGILASSYALSPDIFSNVGNLAILYEALALENSGQLASVEINIFIPSSNHQAAETLIPCGLTNSELFRVHSASKIDIRLLAVSTSDSFTIHQLRRCASVGMHEINIGPLQRSSPYNRDYTKTMGHRSINGRNPLVLLHIRDDLYKSDRGNPYGDIRNATASNYKSLVLHLARGGFKVRRLSAEGHNIGLNDNKAFRDFTSFPFGRPCNQLLYLSNCHLIVGSISGISHLSAASLAPVLFLNAGSLLANFIVRPAHCLSTKRITRKSSSQASLRDLGIALQSDWANYLDIFDWRELTEDELVAEYVSFVSGETKTLYALLYIGRIKPLIPDVALTHRTWHMLYEFLYN
jgi:putative glycosyltransferase (TIGR04372 family)